MITLKNIKKVFETEDIQTWALQNVDLEVKEGECVAIMGPSGCGKSTLLNILGLLDTPTQGTYLLNGIDVSTMDEDQRTDIRKGKLGFVFQSFNLIDELNVSENVELPLIYMGAGKKERRQKVKEVIERVAMSHRAQHFPSQLSGGQQQRVLLARAFCATGKLIVLDEPIAGLDPMAMTEMYRMIADLNREGVAVVMVSHDVSAAVNYATHILHIGKRMFFGTTDEFLRSEVGKYFTVMYGGGKL